MAAASITGTATSHHGNPPPPLPGGAAEAEVDAAVGVAVSCGRFAVNAPTMLRTPNPNWLSRPGGPLSMAVAVNRRTTSGPLSSGNLDRTNATAPATIAVASEVPEPSE